MMLDNTSLKLSSNSQSLNFEPLIVDAKNKFSSNNFYSQNNYKEDVKESKV